MSVSVESVSVVRLRAELHLLLQTHFHNLPNILALSWPAARQPRYQPRQVQIAGGGVTLLAASAAHPAPGPALATAPLKATNSPRSRGSMVRSGRARQEQAVWSLRPSPLLR